MSRFVVEVWKSELVELGAGICEINRSGADIPLESSNDTHNDKNEKKNRADSLHAYSHRIEEYYRPRWIVIKLTCQSRVQNSADIGGFTTAPKPQYKYNLPSTLPF